MLVRSLYLRKQLYCRYYMLVVEIHVLATKKRQVCAHNRSAGNFVIQNSLPSQSRSVNLRETLPY